MSEQPVCHRCGYVGPVDARYCAHCGHALVPLSIRLKRSVDRVLSNLSPFHIGFLGLVLSVPISVFVFDMTLLSSGGIENSQCANSPRRSIEQPHKRSALRILS